MINESNENILFAVIHLQKASELLKYHAPELSLTLLELGKSILDKNLLSEADIENTRKEVQNLIDG